MTSVADEVRPPRPSGLRRISSFLHRHSGIRVAGLVSGPLAWLVLVYLLAMVSLFVTAFWRVDFGVTVTRQWNLDNFRKLYQQDVYRTVIVRTILVASLVTAIDALLALPMAFFMAKVARPVVAKMLVVALLMPLWANYLVKAFAWRAMVTPGGVLESAFGWTPGFGLRAVVITLAYLWLPFMVLPVYAGFERLPDSLLEASSDLGARPGRTLRLVALPMVWPALAAGSIFTFSLSLGDYIAVLNVGGSTQMLGNLMSDRQATDIPFAAALATVSVAIMVVYLTLVRRSGALENL
ncbi:MAG: putative spermidine/putrescine transport system permease protein [Nocardioidaceae bacterium]|jgi:putative spermidine/putrescine transport system permease protein|nr:putative spermidine/putrescine transport system permease protein [Nocardioidaceae bacterium]